MALAHIRHDDMGDEDKDGVSTCTYLSQKTTKMVVSI